MMESRKKKKAKIRHVRAKKKGKGKKLFKTAGISTHPRVQLIHDDPPLSASEIAAVKESRQNIREGKYRDFATVDDVWKFAESD